MEPRAREVAFYVTASGKTPVAVWMERLRDVEARVQIQRRIARLRLGLLGDAKSISGRIRELRVDCGPGYRIYFAEIDELLILLLCAGTKHTQKRDIEKARAYLTDYEERRHA